MSMSRFKVSLPSIAVAAVIALILAAQGLLLWQTYWDTWDLEVGAARNLLGSVSSNIERNLTMVELSIIGMQDSVKHPEIMALPPDLRARVLFDRLAYAPFIGSMLVIGKDGSILADSQSLEPRAGNFADRNYFTAQREADRGTFLSDPLSSRLRADAPIIVLSRRMTDADGAFAGVVIASISIDLFNAMFGNIHFDHRDSIMLSKDNGVVIFRQPSTDEAGNIGLDIHDTEKFRLISANRTGAFIHASPIDGIERYYIDQPIGNFPLVLTVGVSTDDAMLEWRRQVLITVLSTALVCALIVITVRTLRRSLARSQAMEAQLEMLSATDAMTGLPNRRAFDRTLLDEASRAARTKSTLSIVLIDADHFKAVNDRFGHKVGDEVLQRLGATIATSIRRPGDFAARYGGEEFIAILPDTDAAGARAIAERIRANVAAMRPSASAAELTTISASLGVASGHIAPGQDAEELVRQADMALYKAKEAGRNRVVVAAG